MSPRRGLLFRRQLGFREDAVADSQHKTALYIPSARRALKQFTLNCLLLWALDLLELSAPRGSGKIY